MTTWVLEKNVFSERCFDEMVAYFEKHSMPYHIVQIIPFSHEVVGETPVIEGTVVCYGSIGIQKLAKREGWTPGIWTGDKIDEAVVQQQLGSMYLNSDACHMTLDDVWGYVQCNELDLFFLKPDSDTKEFAGVLLEVEEFEKMYDNMTLNGLPTDQNVVLSSPKRTGKEWRLVVVGGSVITCSLYRNNRRLDSRWDLPQNVYDFAREVIEKYDPYDVYVMDIVETDDGLKIIEYNTFNSSGLYSCEVDKIIRAIDWFIFLQYECD